MRSIAIVGCGLIGRKRATAAVAHGFDIVAAADIQVARAEALVASAGSGGRALADWREALALKPDAVVVATTHNALPEIAAAAAEAGCHVLIEKPAARTPAELMPVLLAARRAGVTVKIGFNHRFHPALLKARELVDSGDPGALLYVRGRYGHGGRPGYEKEWRCDPALSGGGELIDQGSHLIDLSRWFLGDFVEVDGRVATMFWNAPVDDNCFLDLRTADGRIAWLHASWTEWKNLFSFEIFGRNAKIQIDGLGGSYGTERLTYYRMKPEMGPPDVRTWEFSGPDTSWDVEFAEFVAAVRERRPPVGNLDDALANLTIIEKLYDFRQIMIIARSPLRITLGGGGTDLPSYYRDHEGFLIAAAIDRYIYITVHKTFVEDLIVKYSRMERVKAVADLQHPIVREALQLLDIDGNGLELTSMADIPEGSGLGSSGSFTTAMLKALHTYRKSIIHPRQLAEQACHIEIERLGEPIGKQDQYIASFGGVTCFRFNKDDSVDAWPLKLTEETLYNLEDNLLLFFTGYSRSASSILKDQDSRTKTADSSMIENLHFIKQLGSDSCTALESGDLHAFGNLMHTHWRWKKERSPGMSNANIDGWYDLAMKNGAAGGKLIGAGGGGFLMFYADDKVRLRHALTGAGLREVRFRFDFEGTKTVVQ